MSTNNHPITAEVRHTQLLNGWWDIQPVAHADLGIPLEPGQVPVDGWESAAFLVPGFFTDHAYPEAWRQGRNAWTRTQFTVTPEEMKIGRAVLLVQAAIPRAYIFVNGVLVANQEDQFIGDEIDVTHVVHAGQNELAIFLTDMKMFAREGGKYYHYDVPWGCCITLHQAGIWQDVTLEWRPNVQVTDVTIRPSVREKSLTVITTVRNDSAIPFHGSLLQVVEDAGVDTQNMPESAFSLTPGESREITQTMSWEGAHYWFPEDPYLYHLRTMIQAENGTEDLLRTRFGFREIWIDGHRFRLNGRALRLGGEWCHKEHSHWLRPEYVRQWYQQLKDLNMNYVRMHTYPHPGYFLDIADEMGIMICQESAIHGSGANGWETPELWPRARKHVARMVRRDKNHPSLIIYSVENEMRWNLNTVPGAKDELPKLRKLFNQLDPTRAAYHEGDSSLWNEEEQDVVSRHYGPACHGWGWWDKKQPLHAGEMGRWHYGSPFTAMLWAGDEVFTHYLLMSKSIGADAARIIELGRANEVSCLFPWNISGLDNFRPAEGRTFTWPEPNSRFIKPLVHKPHESEFAWWETGAGYRPGGSFQVIQRSFRPLAVVIREERTQAYLDKPLPHTVYVVNDLPQTVSGELTIRLQQQGVTCWETSLPLSVESGNTGTAPLSIPLHAANSGTVEIITTFNCAQGSDSVQRTISVASPEILRTALTLPTVALWGESTLRGWLNQHQVTVINVDDNTPLNPTLTPILLVAEGVILPGSTQNQRVRNFVLAGGRVLLLEQNHSIFPGIETEKMPVEMAQVRDIEHPVMEGITRDMLRFFGDDPFGLPYSESWVTMLPYRKTKNDEVVRVLVDSSGGDFGQGGLVWAPVIEARIGKGSIIASQLNLTQHWDLLPVAEHFYHNVLTYLANFTPQGYSTLGADETMSDGAPTALTTQPLTTALTTNTSVLLADGAITTMLPVSAWQSALALGKTVVVWGLTVETQSYWSEVIGRQIDLWTPEHPVYHLVSTGAHSLLTGISNEDTCWLDSWPYTSGKFIDIIVDKLLDIDGGQALLVNAPQSGIDILFGDKQGGEWTRTPAMSTLFDNPLPRVGGGLVVVPVGSGQVIFSQMRWQPENYLFKRFMAQLCWNLGLATATDVLAGDTTSTAGCRSDGFPTTMRVARGVSDAQLSELISLCKLHTESYANNEAFLYWPNWQNVETPEGTVQAAEITGEGAIIIGLEIMCPQPRKFMETVGGLPNPDLQTFLRLLGDGAVQAWVNEIPWNTASVQARQAGYITDIDFENGSNFMILKWQPSANNAKLSLLFENKDRRPEVSFAFEAKKFQ